MKKKIVIGISLVSFVLLLSINVSFIQDDKNVQLTLSSLSIALADEEIDPGEPGMNKVCKEDDCSLTAGPATYYGHYWHCGWGAGECMANCFRGCDAL